MKTVSHVVTEEMFDVIAEVAQIVDEMVAAGGDVPKAALMKALGIDGRGGGRSWKSAAVRAALARGLPELRADLEHEGLTALIV